MTPQEYMQKALNLAQLSTQQDEIPVGCLIVNSNSGEIIASTHNLNQHSEDTTAHAEILAIREACKKLKQNRLWDMDIYVTLEPCTMCAGAIIQARINKVIYGAKSYQDGSIESAFKLYEIKGFNHYPEALFYDGLDKCSKIITNYFKSKR